MACGRPIIRFTDEDQAKARAFARAAAQHTFNRRNVSQEEQERDIYVGKLGEIALARLMAERRKALRGSDDMFTVWNDTRAVDRMDFQTTDGGTVDVKTASLPHHSRILVPYDQYLQQRKDFYVGVRIHQDGGSATIEGFARHDELAVTGVGAYPNYGTFLSSLHPICGLLEQMPDAAGG